MALCEGIPYRLLVDSPNNTEHSRVVVIRDAMTLMWRHCGEHGLLQFLFMYNPQMSHGVWWMSDRCTFTDFIKTLRPIQNGRHLQIFTWIFLRDFFHLNFDPNFTGAYS